MKFKKMNGSQAIREALVEEMERDKNVFLLGEDIRISMYGIGGLDKQFGKDRVLLAPISENGFCGAAVGAALTGKRPVVELMYNDFILLALDAIGNQAAKYRYMCGGDPWKVPVVYRIASSGLGAGEGLHHSQSLEASALNLPGLTVLAPSNPADMKGMLKSAIRYDNPVLFFEYKKLYAAVGNVPDQDDFLVPLGKAKVINEGNDITIISFATGIKKSIEAAEKLAKDGISVEIIDLRTLRPLDKETIASSIEKTGKVIIVEDDPKSWGVGSEISAIIAEEMFEFLDAPVKRVAGEDTCVPGHRDTEEFVVKSVDDIIEVAKGVV